MTSEKKKLFTYTVWALDVWGHSHESCEEYDCPCSEKARKAKCHACDVAENGCKDMGEHCAVAHDCQDEVECQCSFDVNDRSRCGAITVVVTGEKFNAGTDREFEAWHPSTADILTALVEGGFLTERCLVGAPEKDRVVVAVQGEDDATLFLENEENGEPLVQLEFEKSEDLEDAETLPPPLLDVEPLRPFFVTKGGVA